MRTTTGGGRELRRLDASPKVRALVLSASLLAATCTGNTAPPPYEIQLVDASCPPEVSQVILTEHDCFYLVVPEDRSDLKGASVQVFVVRVMPPSGHAAPDPIALLGGNLGEVIGYDDVAPTVARVNRELIVVEARGSARSRPSLTCPEVADAEWDLQSIPMTDPAFEETFLDAAGACYDRLIGEGIDPSAFNLEEMAADVEDLRRALGIEEWNLQTVSSASRIALEVMDRYPDHVRSVILDSPEFPGDGGLDGADEATREAVAVLARYCDSDPACAPSFPDVAAALDEAATQLEQRPIRVQITLPDGRPADAVIDGGSLVRFVRWEMGRPPNEPGIANVPALIYDALQGRFNPTFELEATHAMCVGYGQPCRLADGWNDGLVFSELCHDELPFADPAAAGPGFDEAFGEHPFLDLCRVWSVPPGDPPRMIRSKVPTLVLVGQMDPNISQPVLEEAMAGLDRGFLVMFDGLGLNVLGRECGREIRQAWIEQPLRSPVTSCRQTLSPPAFIAPIPHGGAMKIPPIPDGPYRVKITTSDGLVAGLGEWGWQAPASFAGVLRLTLEQGRFRLHFRTDSPRQDLVGVYRGDGDEVTFVVDEPFDSAGLSWTVGWQATNHGLVLTGTEMGSREDALFYADPGYLAVIGMWMESHPWRLVDRSS
jgi:pimeloyl-ACP methyl ester carboxylesterase